MDELTDTQGIVALAAAGAAALALLLAVVLAWRIRGLRRAQKAVLGGSRAQDLTTHAAGLEREFRALTDYLEDVATGLQKRMGEVEESLRGAIAYHGLVRYDAYNEMSGHQSTSIALLDANRSGVVLSSILHRDQARLYVKQVHDGRAELELSPEEAEAVDLALSGGSERVHAGHG